jgi:hypothetical protein
MTGELQIDYESLAQEAMRGIVRTVLQQVAAMGRLPGDHHFYIAFDTRAPGVVVSKRLKQKYPEEMTIVLQHQFRNLTVDGDRFEVTLSFDNLPERLSVPLRAVRVFFDPSVPYGLQLDSLDLIGKPGVEADGQIERPPGAAPLRPARDPAREPYESQEPSAPPKVRSPRKPRVTQGEAAGEMSAASTAEPLAGAMSRPQAGRPMLVPSQPNEPANDAKVVQLDKFRKR